MAKLNLYNLQDFSTTQQYNLLTSYQNTLFSYDKYYQKCDINNQINDHQNKVNKLNHSFSLQKSRLEHLKLLKNQMIKIKNNNDCTNNELRSIRALFTIKEKELASSLAKVEALTRQLEQLKNGLFNTCPNINTIINKKFPHQLNSLRQELHYRRKLNEKHNLESCIKQNFLENKKYEIAEINEKIMKLQLRLSRKKMLKNKLYSPINEDKMSRSSHAFALTVDKGLDLSGSINQCRMTVSNINNSNNFNTIGPLHNDKTYDKKQLKIDHANNTKTVENYQKSLNTNSNKFNEIRRSPCNSSSSEAISDDALIKRIKNEEKKYPLITSPLSVTNNGYYYNQQRNRNNLAQEELKRWKRLITPTKPLPPPRQTFDKGKNDGENSLLSNNDYENNDQKSSQIKNDENFCIDKTSKTCEKNFKSNLFSNEKPRIILDKQNNDDDNNLNLISEGEEDKKLYIISVDEGKLLNEDELKKKEDDDDGLELSYTNSIRSALDSGVESLVVTDDCSDKSSIENKDTTELKITSKIEQSCIDKNLINVVDEKSDSCEQITKIQSECDENLNYGMNNKIELNLNEAEILNNPVEEKQEEKDEILDYFPQRRFSLEDEDTSENLFQPISINESNLEEKISCDEFTVFETNLKGYHKEYYNSDWNRKRRPVVDIIERELNDIQEEDEEEIEKKELVRAKSNLKGTECLKEQITRKVSFDPLALLLDAALEGELELVKKTVKEVSNPSALNNDGITALHNTICAGHFEIVKYLIEIGCDVNAPDSDGWTPLHCAASCNNLTMVKFLVEKGACIFANTLSDKETPAEKCEESEEGYDGCSEYLYDLQNNFGIINNGEVYAVYDYDSQCEDELSFKDGDLMIVLRRGDEQEKEWWWAMKEGKEGYIPRNLLGLYPRLKVSRK